MRYSVVAVNCQDDRMVGPMIDFTLSTKLMQPHGRGVALDIDQAKQMAEHILSAVSDPPIDPTHVIMVFDFPPGIPTAEQMFGIN